VKISSPQLKGWGFFILSTQTKTTEIYAHLQSDSMHGLINDAFDENSGS
jgi:hypothetical protein